MAEAGPDKRTDQQLTDELCKVLVSWPLYRVLTYKGKEGHRTEWAGGGEHRVGMLPERLSMPCSSSACGQVTMWEANSRKVYFTRREFKEATYTCRNCGEKHVTYFFWWDEISDGGVFLKVGQHPALSHDPPKELARVLDSQDVDYYTKALDCRNFNYGLGAVTYLRRIVEKRINDLLDLLAGVAQQQGSTEDVLARIKEAKTSTRAEERIAIANSLLPERLRVGNYNPFSSIYDITSDAIHRKSEEECIDAFDRSRIAFEYLFIQLSHEKTTKEQYVAGLKVLEEKCKQFRGRRESAKGN